MNIDIRPATKRDIPALCEIWQACFHDSDEYLKLFYEENFGYAEILILTVDGEPASMVHFFDAELVDGKEFLSAKYGYAVGTLPKFRKKGYFHILMKYVMERAKKKGDVLIYKPATRSLGNLFIGLGAKHDTDYRLLSIEPGKKRELSVYDISSEEYNKLRNEAFSDTPYVRWHDEYIRWCIKDNAFFGGRTLGFDWEGKSCFIMCYPEDETLIISETNLSPKQLKVLSGTLCSLFDTKHIKAYMDESTCDEGEKVIATVLYNAPIKHTYVNLLLI